MPDPREGEVLVRGIYLSLDPYMRGRISGARSYAKPVDVGAVIEGRVVGQVARSRHPGFREGDFALGGYGWQLFSAVPGTDAADTPHGVSALLSHGRRLQPLIRCRGDKAGRPCVCCPSPSRFAGPAGGGEDWGERQIAAALVSYRNREEHR
jgi:hypothetical protein